MNLQPTNRDAGRPLSARHFRGMPRPYSEATQLGVIDQRVRTLVAAFNVDGVDGANAVIASVASCEGHGFLGRYSSPYVSFKSPMTVAAALHARLEQDAVAVQPRLRHYWTLEGHFNPANELVFRLAIPGIHHYRHATRRSFDYDFVVLASMVKEAVEAVLDQVGRQHAELNGTEKQNHYKYGKAKKNYVSFFSGTFSLARNTKRVSRVAPTALGCDGADRLGAIDACMQRQGLFSLVAWRKGAGRIRLLIQTWVWGELKQGTSMLARRFSRAAAQKSKPQRRLV